MTERIRVLLAEDQVLFRSGIMVIVNAQPDMLVVGQANDGGEALRLAQATAPDVVLMDVRMKPMDGVEATRRLFAGTFAAPPRVILLTTFGLDDHSAEALRYGASGFLLKDSTPEFMCEAIRLVRSGSAVLATHDLAALMRRAGRAPRAEPPAFATLTERERAVFEAVAGGLNNGEIAARLFISESTVKTHVGAILRKLDLRDRVQIVVYSYENLQPGEMPG